MKFRKKTMATLLAAVLIAMMGVMSALAASDTATLTANVSPTMLGITVDDVVFGDVGRGTLESDTLIITITGEPLYTVDLTATLVDDTVDFPFFDPLTIDTGEATVAVPFTRNVVVGVYNYAISFNVPPASLTGAHSGTLTVFVDNYLPPP